MKTLTAGQKTVLALTTLPMIAVGGFGGWGTYTNVVSEFNRSGTAAGAVAAGEGVTLVLALVMLVLTMFGQPSPTAVRAGLWLAPLAASTIGIAVADTLTEQIVYALTPLGMCGAAEGLGLLARRVVVYTTDTDVEALRRNATTMRRIAYQRARSERHPWEWVQQQSELKAWRLMSRAGHGDAQLGSSLVDVQRERLTKGADAALAAMLGSALARPELPPAQPSVSREPEPGEPEPADFETTVNTALGVTASAPLPELATPILPPPPTLPTPLDQVISREPVLSPAEPTLVSRAEPEPKPTREPASEPEGDEIQQQITELASRLRAGERLTKTSAAELLGVSPATAGRRLKDAKARINEGTGFYP